MARAYQTRRAVVLAWIERLRREAERQAGDTRGPIRPHQRVWSYLLDHLEHERQREAAT
jgi:hypothetical protein